MLPAAAARSMPSPLPRMTGPSMPSCRTVCSASPARSRPASLISAWLGAWPASAASTTSRAAGPRSGGRSGASGTAQSACSGGPPAGVQQGTGQVIRFEPLVHPAQAVAHGFPAEASSRCLRRRAGSPSRRPGPRRRGCSGPTRPSRFPRSRRRRCWAPPAASSRRESCTTVTLAPARAGRSARRAPRRRRRYRCRRLRRRPGRRLPRRSGRRVPPGCGRPPLPGDVLDVGASHRFVRHRGSGLEPDSRVLVPPISSPITAPEGVEAEGAGAAGMSRMGHLKQPTEPPAE